jgi:hypothetical protein
VASKTMPANHQVEAVGTFRAEGSHLSCGQGERLQMNRPFTKNGFSRQDGRVASLLSDQEMPTSHQQSC